MPAFDVTTNPTKLPPLKPGDKATIVVTATSRLPRPVTGRAMAVVVPDSFQKLVKPPAVAQKMFSQAGATQDFPFTVEIAADAKAGSCTTRFDVFDIDNKDDNFGQSSALKIEIVPAPLPVVEEKKKRPWLIWVIVAAAVVVVGVVVWVFVIPHGGKMPDVVGMFYDDAKKLLDDADSIRIVRVDSLDPDTDEYQGDEVIRQDPGGGSKLKGDSNSVTLWVQRPFTRVPDIMGLSGAVAGQRVGAAGLGLNLGGRCQTAASPLDGKVVAFSPPANTLVARNSAMNVTLLVVQPSGCGIIVLPGRERIIRDHRLAHPVNP